MTPRRRITLSVLAIVPLLLAVSGAPAEARAPARPPALCLPVHLSGVGKDQGPDALGNVITTATVSFAGFPIGATRATFTPGGPPAGGVLAFTGPIVFTPSGPASTASGGAVTLTAQVTGSVDLAAGTFQATSTSITAAGVPLAVSGALTFRGTENLTTGAFTETITGRLCASR